MNEKIKGILEDIKEIYYFKPLLDYITNLQEELKSANESISWWQNRFNAVEKENKRLQGEKEQLNSLVNSCQEEIRRLKELCDKYEEEHNTKFNEWVFDKRENERLTQGVTLLTNKLIDMKKERNMFKNSFETMSKNYFEEKSRNKKAIKHIKEYCIDDEFYINLTNKEKNIIDVLNILQDGE